MGKVTTRENDNKTLDLEITYGGKESPFGGIDASAPPNYIDPRCFVGANNFGIYHDKLVAMGWFSAGVNLQGWINGTRFLDSGTICIYGAYYNFALAYLIVANDPGPPPLIDTIYYIWVWPSGTTGNIPLTAQCDLRQFGITVPAVPATATIVVTGAPATVAGSVSVAMGGPTATAAINIGDTPAVVASALSIAINGAVLFGATSVIDPGFSNQINLTSTAVGQAGNNVQLVIGITQGAGGIVPCASVFQGFAGGINAYIPSFGIPINPCSWVQVGETVYFSGYGTVILSFTFQDPAGFGPNNPVFQPITQYLGARTLGKYNNQLIAVGIVPGPGQVIQAAEMIIGWCTSGKFGIWNPVFSDGTVTGAGFNEVSDISDFLTGIFLTPGTSVILRAQGLDYITPLSNGPSPFDFQHISNALKGEGCQHPRLNIQYDQVGFFLGNTDFYQFAGSIQAIGQKIRDLLIPDAQVSSPANKDMAASPITVGDDTSVVVLTLVGDQVYSYCPDNKTWMRYSLSSIVPVFGVESSTNNSTSNYYTPSVAEFNPWLSVHPATTAPPTFWWLQAFVQDTVFPYGTSSYVIFPQEEILFGRDVTIDGVLFSCAGVPGQQVEFSVSGMMTGTFTLPLTASPTVFQNYQLYFTDTLTDKVTIQNPQLRIDILFADPGLRNPLAFSKIAMFGSVDPNQRPV